MPARADEPPQPGGPVIVYPEPPPALAPVPAPPALAPVSEERRRGLHPDKTLLYAGTGLFAAGYLPVAAVGLPSTGGLLARIVIGVGTLGVQPLSCALGSWDGYLCRGDHGSIQLMLPIAGPFLFAENSPKDTVVNDRGRSTSEGVRTALYASGAVQAAGVAMIVSSFALGDAIGDDGRSVPGKAVATSGGVTFATAYGGSLLLAFPSLVGGTLSLTEGCATSRTSKSYCDSRFNGAWLAVPVVGPFLLAASPSRDEFLAPKGGYGPAARALLVADGAVQVAGLAMLVGGLAAGASSSKPAASRTPGIPKLHIVPMTAGATLGVTASLDGW